MYIMLFDWISRELFSSLIVILIFEKIKIFAFFSHNPSEVLKGDHIVTVCRYVCIRKKAVEAMFCDV
jgi:hypothetical protein